ncbi:hypothetical protein BSKO_01731 [Bryopsis sp. KO-2023]|nr:hypothetical protein BSKO_01731 [Bryopsis sp. KO-2023]
MAQSRQDIDVGRRQRGGILSAVSRIRPHKHPKTTTVIFLWMFGLFSMFLSPPLVRITSEMRQNYETKMDAVMTVDAKLVHATDVYDRARAHANNAKVWFWRFRPEHKMVVRDRQVHESAARLEVEKLLASRDDKVAEAKSQLGIWSEAGVEEGRSLFWGSYKQGKVFAQRQTLWDAMFSLFSSRESDALARIIELLLIACFNFTTGMISALFVFIFRLPSFIASFKPGWISGTFYFFSAFVGGASVIATVLALMYGGSFGFIYAVAGPRLARIDAQQRQAGRVGYRRDSGHSHYD